MLRLKMYHVSKMVTDAYEYIERYVYRNTIPHCANYPIAFLSTGIPFINIVNLGKHNEKSVHSLFLWINLIIHA